MNDPTCLLIYFILSISSHAAIFPLRVTVNPSVFENILHSDSRVPSSLMCAPTDTTITAPTFIPCNDY